MKNGAEFDYDFGRKNNWRRQMWNCICERLEVPARDAVVLYLAGSGDLDREVAISKGFKSHNLIAVEWDKKTFLKLRASGISVVKGSFADVVGAWQSTPVDAVFYDGCGSLSAHLATSDALPLLLKPCFANAVIAVNVMRGRDGETNELRSCVVGGKQRARSVFACWMMVLAQILSGKIVGSTNGWIVGPEREITCGRWFNLLERYAHHFAAFQASTYKSTSGQVFDSGVWKNVSLDKIRTQALAKTGKSPHPGFSDAALSLPKNNKARKLKLSVSAIRAIRTRRDMTIHA